MTPAEAEWLKISIPSDRALIGSTGRALPGEFRQLGSVVAWLKWDAETITIARIENTSTRANGGAAALLSLLIELADRYGLVIGGNAISYATDEWPVINQARLVRLYAKAGFTVGPSPYFVLRYERKTRG